MNPPHSHQQQQQYPQQQQPQQPQQQIPQQFVPAVPIVARQMEPISWSIEAPTRWNITPAQRRLLERTYKTHPYPVMSLREQLGRQLGVTPRQIQIWFQNRRQRSRKGTVEEVDDDEEEDLRLLEEEAAQQAAQQAAKHQQAAYRYSGMAPPQPQGMVVAKPADLPYYGQPGMMMPPPPPPGPGQMIPPPPQVMGLPASQGDMRAMQRPANLSMGAMNMPPLGGGSYPPQMLPPMPSMPPPPSVSGPDQVSGAPDPSQPGPHQLMF